MSGLRVLVLNLNFLKRAWDFVADGGGIGRLVHRLGRQSALDLILRGKTLDAQALVQSGLRSLRSMMRVTSRHGRLTVNSF